MHVASMCERGIACANTQQPKHKHTVRAVETLSYQLIQGLYCFKQRLHAYSNIVKTRNTKKKIPQKTYLIYLQLLFRRLLGTLRNNHRLLHTNGGRSKSQAVQRTGTVETTIHIGWRKGLGHLALWCCPYHHLLHRRFQSCHHHRTQIGSLRNSPLLHRTRCRNNRL